MFKVINLGLGRTGTMSLKYALEQIGLTACYHFSDLHKHPEHIPLWRAISQGESVDWDSMFTGYQATVYWSLAYNYQSLLQQYPDIKVILTVREPEKWYQSMHDTIYRYNRLTLSRKVLLHLLSLFRPGLKNLYAMWQLQEETLWRDTFHNRFHDKEHAIAVFNEHIQDVQQKVPADRLLVYKIQEGWQPLCHFLQIPEPNIPFPCVNDSDAFMEWRKQIL